MGLELTSYRDDKLGGRISKNISLKTMKVMNEMKGKPKLS